MTRAVCNEALEAHKKSSDPVEDWKREIAGVLKKHGKVDSSTCGKLTLDINCGGVRGAVWLEKRVD